jgi:DNA-binding CsgD family transcriptional regulator
MTHSISGRPHPSPPVPALAPTNGAPPLQTKQGLLDVFPVGVIVANPRCEVLDTNSAAARLLRAKDGLECDGGRLHASCPAWTSRVRGLVSRACSPLCSPSVPAMNALAVPRPSGARPLQVLVASFEPAATLAAHTPYAAVLYVSDPELRPVLSPERVRLLFGLTQAEAHIATQLALGLTPKEIAARARVQANTIRCQLKQIYQKTGARHQADLVRLLLTGPSVLELP